MRVFVAGATGALGRQLVPQLVASGHEVVGMTRDEAKSEIVRRMGARPAVADALDAEAVGGAISEANPEVIVHQLTALAGPFDPRHLDRVFAVTNRLRTEGTDNLLSAGRAVGARRFVAQSFAGWPFARVGGPVKTEEDPLDPDPPNAVRSTLAAIRYLEETVAGATWTEGIVLRYGGFYGPGTGFAIDPPGDQVEMIRARKFPIVGSGSAVWSFIHIEDAAAATLAAVEHGRPGSTTSSTTTRRRSRNGCRRPREAVGAKPPRRIPRWLARIAAGETATVMMTELRGASNEKAKRELGWRPRYQSWRQGFADGLG